jgi:hypothetical protein
MRIQWKMSIVLLAGMLAGTARAAAWPEACGSPQMKLKVKTMKNHPLTDAPGDGMARLVFVQVLDGDFGLEPVTRFAVDGTWVAADKGASYVAVDVKPGEHKVCAARQTGIKEDDAKIGLVVANAVAGHTTFYQFKITRSEIGAESDHPAGQALGYATPDMTAKRHDTVDTPSFAALDAQKGTELAGKLPMAVSTPK